MGGSSCSANAPQSRSSAAARRRGPKHGIKLNGARLTHLQTLRDWTQLELANSSGLSLASVRRAAQGEPVQIETARSLAAALDTTLDWLAMEGDANAPEPETLSIPLFPWDPSLSPGTLLRADMQGGVPFHGRRLEIKELLEWCKSEPRVAVKLVTGAGGMGKTRLLMELCEQAQRLGWNAGFVSAPRAELFRTQGRTLIVIDYADAALEATRGILKEAMRRREHGPIRIALLARRAGDWWDDLQTTGEGVSELLTGKAADLMPVQPLAPSASERMRAFELACDALAPRLARPVPAAQRPSLTGETYNLILHVHMAALAFIEGAEPNGSDAHAAAAKQFTAGQ